MLPCMTLGSSYVFTIFCIQWPGYKCHDKIDIYYDNALIGIIVINVPPIMGREVEGGGFLENGHKQKVDGTFMYVYTKI